MFEQAMKQILKYDRIIIHRHTKPDGDAIGSQTGLKFLLKENFPEKEVFAVGDQAGTYSFMEGAVMDQVPDSMYEGALAIILDCGGANMVCDERYRLAAETLRIDHHLFSGGFADVEVIDSSYESCCGLIAEFAMEQGLRLNVCGAKALYTGMVTDSGRFRYDSTTSRTFRLAAFLMEQQFDTGDIFRDLYAETYENKKRRAEFLLKVKFTLRNVAYIYTTREELAALDLDTYSASRGMVNTMADIRGVDIWVNFTEAEQGVLCELRSSKYNINPVAVKYGGGGHAKASGATVADRKAAMAMLDDLDKMMGEES